MKVPKPGRSSHLEIDTGRFLAAEPPECHRPVRHHDLESGEPGRSVPVDDSGTCGVQRGIVPAHECATPGFGPGSVHPD